MTAVIGSYPSSKLDCNIPTNLMYVNDEINQTKLVI